MKHSGRLYIQILQLLELFIGIHLLSLIYVIIQKWNLIPTNMFFQ